MKVNGSLGANTWSVRHAIQCRHHRLLAMVLAFFVGHCGGDTGEVGYGVKEAQQRIDEQPTGGATAAFTAGYGGYGGHAGRDSIGGFAGIGLAPRSTMPIISELKVDPPGADGDFEFVELQGEPASILTGYYLVAIEGDAESNTGQIDTLIDLSKCVNGACQFDYRGLLVLAADGSLMPNTQGVAFRESKELSRGGLENGTTSLLLVSSDGALRAGADWDADDDGQLELPIGATVADSVSWTDGDAEDRNYAAEVLGPNPKVHAAWQCSAPDGQRTWCFGQLTGESATLELDPLRVMPQGLMVPRLTPGDANACAWQANAGAGSSNAGSAGIVGAASGTAAMTTVQGGVTGSLLAGGAGGRSSPSGGVNHATLTSEESTVTPQGGFQDRTLNTIADGGSVRRTVSSGGTETLSSGGRTHASGGSSQSSGGATTVSAAGTSSSAGTWSAASTPLIIHGPVEADSGGSTWWSPSPASTTDYPSPRTASAGATARSSTNEGSTAAHHAPEVPGGCNIAFASGSSGLSLLVMATALISASHLRKLASRLTKSRKTEARIDVLRTTGLAALAPGSLFRYTRLRKMSNRAIWNVRRRHEWLTKPIKGKRLTKRSRTRIGLQAAIDRRAAPPPVEA